VSFDADELRQLLLARYAAMSEREHIVMRDVQEIVRRHVPASASLVDELSADRRRDG
jgi:hypothetical protein